MRYTEKLLHFIWQYRLYDQFSLRTSDGRPLQIDEVGRYNTDAGPDFEFSKVRIAGTLWSGHVEIHVNTSDWTQHRHQWDERYDAVILHVVWNDDKEAFRSDGTAIPLLCLSKHVSEDLLDKYYRLMNNSHWIPCEVQLPTVSPVIKLSWLDRLKVERLEEKSLHYHKILHATNGDWEEVMLVALGRAFGMRVNAEAFEKLMLSVDSRLFQKYQYDSGKITALLFGQAGFLHDPASDSYVETLQKEFAYLRKLHGLVPIDQIHWKFLRMRPPNFPTYRIAQLSALLASCPNWFARILAAEHLDCLYELISASIVDEYWSWHYHFERASKPHSVRWTESFFNNLVINCFVPVLFMYGRYIQSEAYVEKALSWLSSLAPEYNSVINQFGKNGMIIKSAADTQALLLLKRHYCDPKRCLECAIGLRILKA